MLGCALQLLLLPRVDVIISLTSPPLISFVAALAVPLKARHLVLWLMDLNPDEAIAAGWLKQNSLPARCLSRMLKYSLHRADRIVVLDRFMHERLKAKNIDDAKISVIPPWSHDDHVRFDASGRDEFRAFYGVPDKFVVMYSGNHSPCHPLDTLMAAAERLAHRKEIVFCFVGGGNEFRKVRNRARLNGLDNVRCFPYQPLHKLSGSLSAADLHVVVMGTPFVGIVHACKIYNILAVGRRFLYVGPERSHIRDIMSNESHKKLGYWCEHGDVDGAITSIIDAQANSADSDSQKVADKFSKKLLVARIVAAIEGLAENAEHSEQRGRRLPRW